MKRLANSCHSVNTPAESKDQSHQPCMIIFIRHNW